MSAAAGWIICWTNSFEPTPAGTTISIRERNSNSGATTPSTPAAGGHDEHEAEQPEYALGGQLPTGDVHDVQQDDGGGEVHRRPVAEDQQPPGSTTTGLRARGVAPQHRRAGEHPGQEEQPQPEAAGCPQAAAGEQFDCHRVRRTGRTRRSPCRAPTTAGTRGTAHSAASRPATGAASSAPRSGRSRCWRRPAWSSAGLPSTRPAPASSPSGHGWSSSRSVGALTD